jgi:hypothetical protein
LTLPSQREPRSSQSPVGDDSDRSRKRARGDPGLS